MKKNLISNYLGDFMALLFPDVCFACGEALLRHEKYLCTTCLYTLPESHFGIMPGNPVEQIFWGRTEVFSATAFARFEKGSRIQHLLHALKYQGQENLGVYMGELMGADLLNNQRFNTVDYVVPVPLHPKKLKIRSYNQSECLSVGISKVLDKPMIKNQLQRKVYNPTQTRKGRFQRWENVDGIFVVAEKEKFYGKHILLVDDVVTTGSTLEACTVPILKCERAKVSVATFAFA